MASEKKRRKAARQAKKMRRPQTGLFRHPDGDRRRRQLAIRVEDAIAQKRAMQQFGAPLPPDEEE